MEYNGGMKNEEPLLPRYTVRRLGIYLYELKRLLATGERYVSAADIAAWYGFDPIMTRKELAMTGVRGEPRRGFPLKELHNAIVRILGFDRKRSFYVIGAGQLGSTLMRDQNQAVINLSCTKAFDVDPKKIGRKIAGVPVYGMKDLARHVRRDKIVRAFLTVPAAVAQACLDQAAAAGIRAVLNFAPTALTVPVGMIVENAFLSPYIATLSYQLSRQG